MRVFLTGATGFVGKEILSALVRGGHRVACLVRGAPSRIGDSSVEVVSGDLLSVPDFADSLRGVDVVVHAAAVVAPSLQRDRENLVRVNRDGAARLARAAKDAGVSRFVFISSIAAMGFWSGHATPESPCSPDTNYGRSKLSAERLLAELSDARFEVVVLRPPTVYGPGEPYNFLDWVRAVDRGVYFFIGSGDNRFPLVTTENVARAVLGATSGSVPPGVHLVADRDPYSMKRIVTAMASALGRRPPGLFVPTALANVAGLGNEIVRKVVPTFPHVLSRARVRTLTVDQRMDVTSLVSAGVPLDAPLEEWVKRTVRDYRRRGVIRSVGPGSA